MYFEFNAPLTAPTYLLPDAKTAYEETVKKVSKRMDTLNEALKIAKIKPETFQRLTSALFKEKEAMYGNADYFDAKTAKELADYALSVYYPPKDDIIDELDRLEFPNADVICDTAYTTNEEWANSLRRLGVGGSDEGVINNSSHWGTLQSVYHSKIGTPITSDGSSQAVFDRGHFLEDRVIDCFCKRTGARRIRDTRMFRSKTHPHCIADIDAIVKMPDGRIYVYEAKTTIMANKDAWRNGKIPASYIYQTRHYPAVLNDDKICGTYIGCLFTVDTSIRGDYVGSQYREDEYLSRFVERDEDTEKDILDAAETFWDTYVAKGVEPEISGDIKKDLALLNSIIGEQDKSLPKVDIGNVNPSSRADAKRYIELEQQISKIKAGSEEKLKKYVDEQNEIKLSLVKYLGKATQGFIRIDDKHMYEIRYSAPNSKVIDDNKMKCDFPDAWEMCPNNKQFWENFENRYPDAVANCVSWDDSKGRRFSVKEK